MSCCQLMLCSMPVLCLCVLSVDAVLYAYACFVLSVDAVVIVCSCASVVVPVCALSAVVLLTLILPFLPVSPYTVIYQLRQKSLSKTVFRLSAQFFVVYLSLSTQQQNAVAQRSRTQQRWCIRPSAQHRTDTKRSHIYAAVVAS